jgi:hypothetical protein
MPSAVQHTTSILAVAVVISAALVSRPLIACIILSNLDDLVLSTYYTYGDNGQRSLKL